MKAPKILVIEAKKVIGLQSETSMSNSSTARMWGEFMQRRKEVKNCVGDDLLSIQVYPKNLKMADFTDDTVFVSWAATEVSDFDNTPVGMESRVLPGGLYARFRHKGATSEFHKTAQFIFEEWMPGSDYDVDDREHFEVLSEKYLGPNDPNSEEDVFIPIKQTRAIASE